MQTDVGSHKRQRLHCHITFPDKATGNCYVKKIMLTLRIILSLSDCFLFFFLQRGLKESCRKKKRSLVRQTFGCFSLLLNGWKMLIGVHVSKKTKGKGGGEGRSVHVRKGWYFEMWNMSLSLAELVRIFQQGCSRKKEISDTRRVLPAVVM